jgi:hypothetical protein
VIVLTESTVLRCGHKTGHIGLQPSQSLVRIDGKVVLVRPDPEHRPIDWCDNGSPTTKSCQHTLQVHTGYSTLVRIDGQPIVLDNLEGVTDGFPPAGATYQVQLANQSLLRGDA